jgi:hypothetical protein
MSIKCSIRYVEWGHTGFEERTLDKRLSIGRAPKEGGLGIASQDEFVSANAVLLVRKVTGVEIQNTSTHSQIEVHHLSGVRYLFPGESLTVNLSSKVVIPSKDFNYSIEVIIDGDVAGAAVGSHTRRLIPEDLVIAQERIPALAGLCANYLFPQHFGSAPLKASEISAYLAKRGLVATPKAINHKIQRTREQVEEYTGTYLDDREGLAVFLIKNQIITADHVKTYLL